MLVPLFLSLKKMHVIPMGFLQRVLATRILHTYVTNLGNFFTDSWVKLIRLSRGHTHLSI